MDGDEQRIRRLEEQVQRLQAAVESLERAVTWTRVDDAAPAARAVPAPLPADARPSPVHAGTQQPPPVGSHAARPGLETQIGTRWLAVAGITVFVVAAVLFLRLAIANGWIGPGTQLAIIALLGVLVWGLGAYLHRGRRLGAFPDVLAAGGLTITAFAAYASYGLHVYRDALGVSQELAAVLLAIVALAGLADAVLRRTEVQAGLVTVLVPLTAGFVLEWTAFSLAYTVAMTAALLVASAWRRWAGIPIMAALGSYTIVLAHTVQDDLLAISLGSALVLLAAFNGLAWRAKKDAAGLAAAQGVAWVGTWGVGLWALRQWGVESWWWTAALGAAAMALSFLPATRWQRLAWRVVGLAGLIGFVAFLPWPQLMAPVWIAQLAAAGMYRNQRAGQAAEAVTAVLSGLVMLRLLAHEAPRIDDGKDLVAIAWWLAAVVLFGILWATARPSVMPRVHLGLGVAGAALLALLLLNGPAVSLVWAVLAAALVAAGFMARRIDVRVAGLAMFAITLMRVLFADLAGVDAAWRVLAFAGIGLALLGTSWLYVRWERKQAAVGRT